MERCGWLECDSPAAVTCAFCKVGACKHHLKIYEEVRFKFPDCNRKLLHVWEPKKKA
jgi:hypothetical protein